MKTSVKQVIAVIAIVAIIAASLPIAAFGMAETNLNVQPDEIWDGSISEGFAGGTGTEADPYLISNGAELAYLAQQTNSGISYQGSYFALTNDIYLNDTTDWERWGNDTAPANEWTAIGTESSPFSGSFDGNGFAVHGVYINEPEAYYQGLFGCASRSTIANIGVSESCIYAFYHVGGVVGDSYRCTISNCYNVGSVTGEREVGGIVGTNTSTVDNCYNTGSVTGIESVGGVVGCNWCSSAVTNCYNTGSVTGLGSVGDEGESSWGVGGVVGFNAAEEWDASVVNCYNSGSVTGENSVGGVVGQIYGESANGYAENCYNIGSVTGSGNVGGVVGGISGYSGNGYAENCYNTGSVTGENSVGGVVGGISGYSTNCYAENCYNVGSVTGTENVGGMAGSIGDNINVEVTNCYYLDTCCESGDEYAVALTDEQMQAEASFVGFDFEIVWTMEGNQAYPYPELISNPHTGSVVPGDLDGDGEITTIDANMVLRIALYLEDYNSNGDVDNDGTVTLADANTILRWALGL
ncbi:MAG: dockerin type I repeat-containing protein [Eubacteriales bacterium]|nr:dockerin type I repeat-containing protein [Eubacteriales bacterium]